MSLAYDTLPVHRWMLRDRPRMAAFERAIRERVKPGDVVLDVGAGSGILSLLAARAGAARVYAVERTPVAGLARRLAAANGLSDVVRVAQADIRDVTPPERVDLIVSEWMGTIGVDENLLPPVLLARDRWLKPGGAMLPSMVRAMVAPACLSTRCDADFFHSHPFGLDLSALAEPSVHDLLCRRHQVLPADLACEARILWSTDAATLPLAAALAPVQADLEFVVERACRVNALVAWFEAELSPGVVLANAPGMPETHWGQLTLPLHQELELPARARLQARVACLPRVPGLSDLGWSVSVDGGPWRTHDTRTASGFPEQEGAVMNKRSRPVPAMPRAAPAPEPSSVPPPSGLPPPGEAASLTRFLARLSVDPDLLHRVILDPMATFEREGLSKEDIEALVSRQAAPIEQAMMKGAGS